MKHKKNKAFEEMEPITLDIPASEIWDYQVDGLRAPAINKEVKSKHIKQLVFIVVVVIAVLISCYFSVRAVKRDTFEFSQTENDCILTGFSNTGYITKLTLNYKTDIEYNKDIPDPEKNFKITEEKDVPLTALGEFAFNCDNNLTEINIGENVLSIDGSTFYSCWSLECINVDEKNPNYCSVEGVLFNKDKTQIICYPIRHSAYLMKKYGFAEPVEADDAKYESYKKNVLTYTVPETVKTIGELCFNYTDLVDIYLPDGVKTIETMGFFKSYSLKNIYTYKGNAESGEKYVSLPDSVEYIGSDAFSYNQSLEYVFIPSNVTHIGHHAFWECVYKSDGNICGLSEINIAESEADFHKDCTFGDQWLPEYDYALFKKKIPVNYGAQRVEYKTTETVS